MSSTKNDGWLQKLMYVLIVVLGIYILYKGTELLVKNESFRQSVESSTLPKNAEDAAVRTYAPGYAAAVEGKSSRGWLAGLMEPLLPVYSYLVGLGSDEESEVSTGGMKGSVNKGQAPESKESEQTAESKDADNIRREEKKNDAGEESVQTEENMNGAEKESVRTEETEHSEEHTQTEQSGEDETEEALEAAGMGSSMDGGSLMTGQLKDFDYLLANYYTLDAGTTIDSSLLDARKLLAEDLSIQKDPEVPQILIYHTHSQEAFSDSTEGEISESIVGMGEVLAEILRTKYGYQVIHDTGTYDLVDGVLDRSAAYDYARESVQKILDENPDIEVVIDLHRDGVDGQKFVTEIDGKPCSMVMFFNGLSRDESGNPLTWLDNPYVADNLAFSLQLQLKARQQYPGFTRNIYLKAERFNLHLRPRSLLIEAGTQLNTVEEEQNAMEPLADLLNQVLSGV